MSEQTCFVIAPIGEPNTDVRKRSDQILKHLFKPAAEACGYKGIRADEISEPGIITSQVIQHIVEDPMVIADLTGRNPNVFYELALRHALKKPLVQAIEKGEQLPFDVAPTRTVQIDIHDLDSVEEAKEEMIAQMKAVEKEGSEIDSPISVALDLQILRQSERPEDRSLADIVGSLSDMRKAILSLQERLEPTSLLPPGYIQDIMMETMLRTRPRNRDVESRLKQARHLVNKIEMDFHPRNIEATPGRAAEYLLASLRELKSVIGGELD